MKFVFLFSLFCVLVVASRAAEEIHNGQHKDYPGRCYRNGLVMKPGDVFRRQKVCERLTCDNKYQVHVETCDELRQGEERGNPEAKYPDCCLKN